MPVGQLPGLNVPDWWLDTGTPAFGSALLIDATGEKAGMVGRVHIPAGGSKNISKVGFKFGAVTNPALTTLTLSLQDVSLTTGMPDETQDQSVTIANASITALVWFEATLGATRTVTDGDLLAVVWEFLNFVATASVVIQSVGGQLSNQICYCALKSGAGPTWAFITAAASIIPNVTLGFDDGTYGTLLGSGVWFGLGATTLSNATANKEVGAQVTCKLPGIIEGCWAFVDLDGDTTINLYEAAPDGSGETLKTSITLDKDVRNQTNNRLLWVPFPAEVNMQAGWIYTVALQPTTATAITYANHTVNIAAYLAAVSGGQEIMAVTRATAGSGAWTALSTQRFMIGFRFRGARYPVRSAGMAT